MYGVQHGVTLIARVGERRRVKVDNHLGLTGRWRSTICVSNRPPRTSFPQFVLSIHNQMCNRKLRLLCDVWRCLIERSSKTALAKVDQSLAKLHFFTKNFYKNRSFLFNYSESDGVGDSDSDDEFFLFSWVASFLELFCALCASLALESVTALATSRDWVISF